MAVIYSGVAAAWDRWKNLEGSLTFSPHTRGHCSVDILSMLPSPSAPKAWIWDVEVKLYVYVLSPARSQLIGASATPCWSGYSGMSSLGSV
jgi:hypothetical protein